MADITLPPSEPTTPLASFPPEPMSFGQEQIPYGWTAEEREQQEQEQEQPGQQDDEESIHLAEEQPGYLANTPPLQLPAQQQFLHAPAEHVNCVPFSCPQQMPSFREQPPSPQTNLRQQDYNVGHYDGWHQAADTYKKHFDGFRRQIAFLTEQNALLRQQLNSLHQPPDDATCQCNGGETIKSQDWEPGYLTPSTRELCEKSLGIDAQSLCDMLIILEMTNQSKLTDVLLFYEKQKQNQTERKKECRQLPLPPALSSSSSSFSNFDDSCLTGFLTMSDDQRRSSSSSSLSSSSSSSSSCDVDVVEQADLPLPKGKEKETSGTLNVLTVNDQTYHTESAVPSNTSSEPSTPKQETIAKNPNEDNKLCRNGNTCYFEYCKKSHPEGWDPKNNIPMCNLGRHCRDIKCFFKHPADRLPVAVGRCITSRCIGNNCMFLHSKMQNICPNGLLCIKKRCAQRHPCVNGEGCKNDACWCSGRIHQID